MPLGIDATLRYGLHIPPTQSILESQLAERQPVQHAQALRAAADADREPRARLDPGGRASRAGRLPLLRAQARQACTTSSRRARPRSTQYVCDARLRLLTTHVALLGHPVAHSLSPRMQNAAFAARGLDWHYAAFDVDDVVAAVAALRDARLRRRERDDPAQAGGRRRLRRGRRRRREHARLPRRPRARLQHRPGDPRRDRRDAAPA